MPNKLPVQAAAWLRSALAAGVRGAALPNLPSELRGPVGSLVERHRLQGLFFTWGSDEPGWRLDYLAGVARAERWLREAHRMAELLEGAGIPCLVLRGPLAAWRWHGDPAARAYADLDLLVPEAMRRAAYDVLIGAGYEDQAPGRPRRYFETVHYHYALRQKQGDVRCDLHWAVDHPFRRQHVPFQHLFDRSNRQEVGGRSWRLASPEFDLLLSALHVAKEWRQSVVDLREDPLVAAWWTGQLARFVDLARMQIVLGDSYQPERVTALAREAGAGPEVVRVLRAASCLRDAAGPLLFDQARPRLVEDEAWNRLQRQWSGCLHFVRPPSGLSAPARITHRMRAAWRLGASGTVAAACLLAEKMRPTRRFS